ncbi:MAG: VCBS repeat-containing protein [Deltaproteobacteria bacterium]|nr:VCBS repeat-containing protein [Deltaproteobacteria bacterium]
MKKLIFFLLMMIVNSNLYAAEKAKVLLVPFQTESENDISFLKNSITEIIESKLKNDSIVKISKLNFLESKKLLSHAKKQSFDFIITGEIKIDKKGYELSGSLLSVKQKKKIVFLNQKGVGTGTIFVHVNSFTDKILRVGLKKETEQSFVKIKKTPGWKSKELDFNSTSMTKADFDGDGKSELVISSSQDIYIYSKKGDKLKKVIVFDPDTSFKVYGVDAFDLNKNGKVEIFITAINIDNNRLNSFVIEWNGEKFVKILKNQYYHFRIVELNGKSKVLAQKAKVYESEYEKGTAYEKELFEVIWDGEKYKYEIYSKEGLRIYSFINGDVTNENKYLFVTFNKNDRISVMGDDKKEIWLSGESLGGTEKYFKVTSKYDSNKKEKVYLSQRLFIDDIDNDGKNELITVHNENKSSLLPNSRTFTSASIKVFSWGPTGFDVKFQSSKYSGYISDFYVGDIDNDGKKEIVYAVVSKKSIFSSKKTVIYTYNLY